MENLFENLKENVSEVCFNEIVNMVEKLLNEEKNIKFCLKDKIGSADKKSGSAKMFIKKGKKMETPYLDNALKKLEETK